MLFSGTKEMKPSQNTKKKKIGGNHGKTKKAKHWMERKAYQKRKYDES